jgi:hypothetical protein
VFGKKENKKREIPQSFSVIPKEVELGQEDVNLEKLEKEIIEEDEEDNLDNEGDKELNLEIERLEKQIQELQSKQKNEEPLVEPPIIEKKEEDKEKDKVQIEPQKNAKPVQEESDDLTDKVIASIQNLDFRLRNVEATLFRRGVI